MTERGLSTNLITASESDVLKLVYFVKLELDSGTLYLHTGVGGYTWNSQTWLGLGDFGGISAIQEADEMKSFDITLILSGLDTDMMDEVLNQDYYLRPVTIFIGAVNIDSNVLLADPDEIWSGFMDVATATLGAENTINIQCENEFSVFNKSNGSAFSDADLQQDYNGDLFFEFLPSMTDSIIVWRGKDATAGARAEESIIARQSGTTGREPGATAGGGKLASY